MVVKGKIALDDTMESYCLAGGNVIFQIPVSSKEELHSKNARYEKFLKNRSFLIGNIDDSPDFVVFPLGGREAYFLPHEPRLVLMIVYDIDDYFIVRNIDIRNIIGMRFEDIVLSFFTGAIDRPLGRPIFWDFEFKKRKMSIGLDPFRAYRKKNRCGAIILKGQSDDWNDFVTCYNCIGLLVGFCFFLADMNFQQIHFLTKDGSPAHYYHLVPRSVWERAAQRHKIIVTRADCLPSSIFIHHISEAVTAIFKGEIYELHYPLTHESDAIYAYEVAGVFSAFEAEFHLLYGDVDAKLLGKPWIGSVERNISSLSVNEKDLSAKTFYDHCLDELKSPSLKDRFRYFFNQEKILVDFVLKGYFLCSIPEGKLLQTLCRIRNNLMHGNPVDLPEEKMPELFLSMRCFVYILQFRRFGFDEKDIKIMLNHLFHLSADLPEEKQKGVEVHWGRQSKKPGGWQITDWKKPI